MKMLEHSEAYYEEKVEERLKRVLNLESTPEYKLTVEELERWVTESKAKKRIKQRRFMAIAASITLMISALVCVEYFHETNRYTAIAGNNDKQISEESGTVVVKDNQVGVDEHAGARKEKHTTWEAVLEAQERHPELLVPGYVPEDWEFERLEIEEDDDAIKASFEYWDMKTLKVIRQLSNFGETVIKDFNEKIISSGGISIYTVNDESNVSTFVIEENKILVIGGVTNKEISKIADNIKRSEDKSPH